MRAPLLLLLAGALGCAASPSATLPEAARAPYRAGLEQLAAGRSFAAVHQLLLAWRQAPDHTDVHHALAHAYRAKGRLALAKWHLRAALARAPQRHDARLELARLETASGRYTVAEAEARALLEDPDFPRPWEALNELGWAQLQAGRLEEARASFGRALDDRPQHAPALLRLGVLEAVAQQPLLALALFSRALASRPSPALESEARVRRAEVLALLGLEDVAIQELRRASTRAPQAAWARKARQPLAGWSRGKHAAGAPGSAGAIREQRHVL
jgi:Tfp pilus assembly protein PilF